MARKKIREYDSKRLLKEHLRRISGIHLDIKSAQVTEATDFSALAETEAWLSSEKLVVKPDMLFGKRGKSGLVALNLDLSQVAAFAKDNLGKEVEIGGCKGPITTFIVEPFIPHTQEYYLSIVSERLGCSISFSECGGIEIEDNWDKVKTVFIPTEASLTTETCAPLLATLPLEVKGKIEEFTKAVFAVFLDLDFTFLEMNPFTLVNGNPYPLDLRGELDDTAAFKNFKKHDPVEGNRQKNTCTYHADGSTGKSPSRSARRKKVKRQGRRKMQEMAIQQMEKDMQSQVPANDPDHASAKHQTVDQIAEAEDEIVPIIVRPGHIRFESSDAEQSKLQSKGPVETLQWNGTTSKKKGQKWGREKTSSKRNGDNACNGASNEKIVAEDGKHIDGHIVFESLYPLTRLPEEGDVLVYRLVELSSSWCPELSPFRVGKVSSYDSRSMKIVLVPVSEYPLFSKQKNDAEEAAQQPDVSHYKEDGSLEIEYPSLVDVRLLKPNESEAENMSTPQSKRTTVAAPVNSWESALAKNTAIEMVTPLTERRPNMGWEQIEQALSEKKTELQQNNGWGSWTPNKNTSTTSWSYRALRGSALGPTLALLRGKEAKYASTVNGKHASSANGKHAGSNGKNSSSTSRKYSGPTKTW